MTLDWKLLLQLNQIHSPSGSEASMKAFILDYVRKHSAKWMYQPQVVEHLHDNLILIFGQPRTAIFAHMDTTGFTVRYQDQLVPIGGPDVETGYALSGKDAMGPIACRLRVDEEAHQLFYDFPRAIETGTSLTWDPFLERKDSLITGTYLDNRLGLYNALKVAETLKDGAIVFSTYEEHGGGAVPMLIQYLMVHHPVKQVLISDITWVTEGVQPGEGVVVSLRDKHIPRRSFLDRVIELAVESGIPFQLEVEGNGSSDGREIHHSPYAVDWCFIGAPEDAVHSPREVVHEDDLLAMIRLYQYLMDRL